MSHFEIAFNLGLLDDDHRFYIIDEVDSPIKQPKVEEEVAPEPKEEAPPDIDEREGEDDEEEM